MTQQFITIIADHKGNARPKAVGDEYVVDCFVKMTVYHDADVINASDVGLSSITAATITGQSTASNDGKTAAFIEVTNVATGAYTSNSSVTMLLVQALQATPAEVADGGTHSGMQMRVRVWGQI